MTARPLAAALLAELLALPEEELRPLAARLAPLLPRPAPPEAPAPYVTVVEAAALLRCKRARVDDLLSQGKLTRVKDGRRTLVSRSELEAYLRGSC